MDNYTFKVSDLDSQIDSLVKKGVTELYINDENVSKNKNQLIKLLKLVQNKAPQLFISIVVNASVIDKEIVMIASQLFCSFEIPLEIHEKGGKILFDKKFYANKSRLLNDFGIVFGFIMSYATVKGDTLKLFMDRLDFAINQYPNHINFSDEEVHVSGCFSAQDIRYARDVSFACTSFYSEGRAVTWMLCVLKPLRIYPSRFFADFSEWQRCNNCDYKSGFIPEKENHKSLEKMQLLFIEQKLEEKNCYQLYPLVKDLILLNGAISRASCEKEEIILNLSYTPEDLFSEEIMNLESFIENVCMMECKVKVFFTEEGPDYEYLN